MPAKRWEWPLIMQKKKAGVLDDSCNTGDDQNL